MTDSVKKIIIPKSQLPPLNGDLEKYVVRYRIISEDRNRISHWSPQYLIAPTPLSPESLATADVVKSGSSVIITWNTENDVEVPTVDIFVAWGSTPTSVGLYEYYATVTANTITIPVPNGSQSVDAKIQLTVYPRKLVTSRIIADSGVVSLV